MGSLIAAITPFQKIPRLRTLVLMVASASAIAAAANPEIFDIRAKSRTKGYPVETVDQLRLPENSGRLLPYYDWSGLIIWRVPGRQLFISPINDSYPRHVFEMWWMMALTTGPWREILDACDIDVVLFPASAPLVGALLRDPGWVPVAGEGDAVLLRRRPGAKAPYVAPGNIGLKPDCRRFFSGMPEIVAP
jgi:hypothetical protein